MSNGQQSNDLWPEDAFAPPVAATPRSILQEQAAALSARTSGSLHGEVVTSNVSRSSRSVFDSSYDPGTISEIVHRFRIVVPALDDYRYELLTVRHEVINYPATVRVEGAERTVNSDAELRELLRFIFASERAIQIVRSLLAQARDGAAA